MSITGAIGRLPKLNNLHISELDQFAGRTLRSFDKGAFELRFAWAPGRRMTGTLDAGESAKLSKAVQRFVGGHPPIGDEIVPSGTWCDAWTAGESFTQVDMSSQFGRSAARTERFIANDAPQGWKEFLGEVDSTFYGADDLRREFFHPTYKTWLPY